MDFCAADGGVGVERNAQQGFFFRLPKYSSIGVATSTQ